MNKPEKLVGIQKLMNAKDHITFDMPVDAYGEPTWEKAENLLWDLAHALLSEPTN